MELGSGAMDEIVGGVTVEGTEGSTVVDSVVNLTSEVVGERGSERIETSLIVAGDVGGAMGNEVSGQADGHNGGVDGNMGVSHCTTGGSDGVGETAIMEDEECTGGVWENACENENVVLEQAVDHGEFATITPTQSMLFAFLDTVAMSRMAWGPLGQKSTPPPIRMMTWMTFGNVTPRLRPYQPEAKGEESFVRGRDEDAGFIPDLVMPYSDLLLISHRCVSGSCRWLGIVSEQRL